MSYSGSLQKVKMIMEVLRGAMLVQASSTDWDGGPLKGEDRSKVPLNRTLRVGLYNPIKGTGT